jgi:phosphatidate cytidylyltransferase
LLSFFAAVALLSWAHILRGMAHHTLPGLAATIFGVVYLGWMPAHLVLMHQDPVGPGLVTLLIAMVAMSDTGAYFTGRAIGKHKLAPHTSPKKTWEGAAGVASWPQCSPAL